MKKAASAPLLDRQLRLLEYLTSGAAIHRDNLDSPLDASLAGIDRSLLNIEARFSYEKRMEKIAAVFPITLRLLGAGKDAILREFADACPPMEISRIANAWQLHDFLLTRWHREPPGQSYLPDVMTCELVCAQVRISIGAGMPVDSSPRPVPGPLIRRHPELALLRTGHNVRDIFEGRDDAVPEIRQSLLAIALNHGEPKILEIAQEVFDLLESLDEWTAADNFGGAETLLAELTEAGMLEWRP